MQLADVKKVKQVVGESNANAQLKDGWQLLAVVPSTLTGNGQSSVIYVLGKPADEEEWDGEEPPMPIT